jgi:RNA polymerase sigma-70 factor (ECF subfamily)
MDRSEDSIPYRFPTTQWTAVGAAGGRDTVGGAALSDLLARYLGPLRMHLLRHRRLAADRAEELLQAFVAEQVLERELVGAAVREKGRFRTFLLLALDRFVSNQLRGQRRRSAREAEAGDDGLGDAPAAGPSPSGAFEVAWAQHVLAETARRMRAECDRDGRPDVWAVFEGRVLSPTLEGAEPVSYEDLATRLGVTQHAAANLLVTGKRMFARRLRGVVGEYMGEGGEVEQEIAELRAALARGRG